MPEQSEPLDVDELRYMSGVDLQVHKSLEEVAKNINIGYSPLMTLMQSNVDVE